MAGYTMTQGGVKNVLNITAPTVIKAAPGNLVTITVSGTPTAGALTINDCTTTSAAAAANQIVSIAYGSLTQPIINANWFVCLAGITISAVPTGATISVCYA
jgi:hypothetical protein